MNAFNRKGPRIKDRVGAAVIGIFPSRIALVSLIGAMLSGCAGISPPDQQSPISSAIEGPSLTDRGFLAGIWEYRSGDIVYELMLDDQGNGSYSWQNGHFRTTKLVQRDWAGTWHQPGNDREGAFEAVLAEDGRSAKGRWWYTRIGADRDPHASGGTFLLVRKTPAHGQ